MKVMIDSKINERKEIKSLKEKKKLRENSLNLGPKPSLKGDFFFF